MFRVARKIRVGRETGNTHIFFFGLVLMFHLCTDFHFFFFFFAPQFRTNGILNNYKIIFV